MHCRYANYWMKKVWTKKLYRIFGFLFWKNGLWLLANLRNFQTPHSNNMTNKINFWTKLWGKFYDQTVEVEVEVQ